MGPDLTAQMAEWERLLTERQDEVLGCQAEGVPAAQELMAHLVEHLREREECRLQSIGPWHVVCPPAGPKPCAAATDGKSDVSAGDAYPRQSTERLAGIGIS